MDCVNHTGTTATAFCQNCGKALCSTCARQGAGGQVLCEPCSTAWQAYQQPFVSTIHSSPNPSAAAVLGLIPGVGAMYNGQFFKGLIHVVIFAVLISLTSNVHGGAGVFFALMIPAWILYQAFEAFHTARAIRDGRPLPDPLGLNEVGTWLNLGGRSRQPGQAPPNPGVWSPSPNPGPPPQAPPAAGYQPPYTGGAYQTPYTNPYQTPYQAPYTPAAPVDPAAPGFQPVPGDDLPPQFWRRKEPIGAIVLIAIGMLFLLSQLDIFHGRLIEFIWPVFLIGIGAWLIVRRLGETQGGSK
jgi:TM2 domain-containing membrane protein YozV